MLHTASGGRLKGLAPLVRHHAAHFVDGGGEGT